MGPSLGGRVLEQSLGRGKDGGSLVNGYTTSEIPSSSCVLVLRGSPVQGRLLHPQHPVCSPVLSSWKASLLFPGRGLRDPLFIPLLSLYKNLICTFSSFLQPSARSVLLAFLGVSLSTLGPSGIFRAGARMMFSLSPSAVPFFQNPKECKPPPPVFYAKL